MHKPTHLRSNLLSAASAILTEGCKIEVPRRVIDHAKKVGLPQADAETIYRLWIDRVTIDDILKKIAREAPKKEAVDENFTDQSKTAKLKRVNDAIKGEEDRLASMGADARASRTAQVARDRIVQLKKAKAKIEKMTESTELEEGISPDLYKRAKAIGWKKKVMDDMFKLLMSNPNFTDKDVIFTMTNTIEYQEKKKNKNESADLAEAKDTSSHTPNVTKAMNFVKGFNAAEMESFLLGLAEYFVYSHDDMSNAQGVGSFLKKAYTEWKHRKSKNESVELDEAKDEYALMKEVENRVNGLSGDFRNFHNAHEEDALREIRGTLSYCVGLTDKIKKML